jgi:hypothetical protein
MPPTSIIASITSLLHGTLAKHDGGVGRDIDLPEITTATGIGITVAISGNILISLALNLQKLAHRRVDLARAKAKLSRRQPISNGTGGPIQAIVMNEVIQERGADGELLDEEDLDRTLGNDEQDVFGGASPNSSAATNRTYLETQHLLRPGDGSQRSYGVGHGRVAVEKKRFPKQTLLSRLFSIRLRSKRPVDNVQRIDSNVIYGSSHSLGQVEEATPGLANGRARNGKNDTNKAVEKEGNESDYLKSKLW